MEQKINITPTLAHHLKLLRLDAGFGVTELCRYFQLLGVDITRECMVKIEAGKHNLSIEHLWAYTKSFNTDYNQLFSFMEDIQSWNM